MEEILFSKSESIDHARLIQLGEDMLLVLDRMEKDPNAFINSGMNSYGTPFVLPPGGWRLWVLQGLILQLLLNRWMKQKQVCIQHPGGSNGLLQRGWRSRAEHRARKPDLAYRQLNLTQKEIANIIAFMKALTDPAVTKDQ